MRTAFGNPPPVIAFPEDFSGSDSERLIAAVNAPGVSVVMLRNGTTYELDRNVALPDGVTIEGNNAWAKRIDDLGLTLTAAAANGATTLEVSDGSLVKVGMRLQVLPNLDTGDDNASSQAIVTDVSSNTVTLSAPLVTSASYVSGAAVVVAVSMFTASGGNGVVIRRVNFDGNSANNTRSRSWRMGSSISISGDTLSEGPGSLIEWCQFKDSPGETVVMSKGAVKNCTYKDLEGSFIHISSPTSSIPRMFLEISNNEGVNACQTSRTINGHNEGTITFSAASTGLRVFGNKFVGGGEGVLGGGFTGDDNEFVVFDNVFADHAQHVVSITGSSDGNVFTMHNNTVLSCGDLILDLSGGAFHGVQIKDNIMPNCRLVIDRCRTVQIEGNTLGWADGLYGFSGFSASYGVGVTATSNAEICGWIHVGAIGSDNVRINGNWIIGDPSGPHTDQVQHAIIVYNIRASGDSNTDGYLDIVGQIKNNVIAHAHFGISAGVWHANTAVSEADAVLGWDVSGNQIALDDAADGPAYAWGINAFPGMEVYNNHVYIGNNIGASTTAVMGIYAPGVHDNTSLRGVHAHHNNVYGGSKGNSIKIGHSAGGVNRINALVEHNRYDRAMTDQSAGQSTVDSATNEDFATLLPAYPTPVAPVWKTALKLEELPLV